MADALGREERHLCASRDVEHRRHNRADGCGRARERRRDPAVDAKDGRQVGCSSCGQHRRKDPLQLPLAGGVFLQEQTVFCETASLPSGRFGGGRLLRQAPPLLLWWRDGALYAWQRVCYGGVAGLALPPQCLLRPALPHLAAEQGRLRSSHLRGLLAFSADAGLEGPACSPSHREPVLCLGREPHRQRPLLRVQRRLLRRRSLRLCECLPRQRATSPDPDARPEAPQVLPPEIPRPEGNGFGLKKQRRHFCRLFLSFLTM